MRTLIISKFSRALLSTHILGQAVKIGEQLADTSYEAEVDDDMAFALDALSGNPDEAIWMICTQDWAWCYKCERRTPTLDGDCCAYCKLVR